MEYIINEEKLADNINITITTTESSEYSVVEDNLGIDV